MPESFSHPPTKGPASEKPRSLTANGHFSDEFLRRLQDDQRSRWLRDDRVRIDAYLEQFPTLRNHVDTVIELIKNEFELRLANGEQPAIDEYTKDFPEYEAE